MKTDLKIIRFWIVKNFNQLLIIIVLLYFVGFQLIIRQIFNF